ncbi:MAG: Fe-S protein assembly co-chaperone HscB [Gammaproteobacteria bacterium]|nr:Fe-S protein assembly co-chaperone HscB [Gammaproteobacteria bacterium]
MATAGLTHNYFELFNLPADYDLDLTELSTRYRTLQATVHPDKFANATDLERRLSMQQSALINEAYQTLKNPLLRARYMLQLKGVDLSVESSVSMDSGFLMQQIRLREELEQVRSQKNPEAKLLVVAKEIEQAIAEQVVVLTGLFKEGNEKKLPQIADYVRRMQFMVKLQQETEALEEELIS